MITIQSSGAQRLFDHPTKFNEPLKADSHIACRSPTMLCVNSHNMPFPCCAHAIPLPCCALIHTCHATPLPCSDSAVSFVNVRMVVGNIQTASPQCNRSSFFVVRCYHSFLRPWQTVFGFTLATCIWDWYASDKNFVELRVVAGRSRTWASSPHAHSQRPCCAVALRRRAWQVWIRHSRNV